MLNAIKNLPSIICKAETTADNSIKAVFRSRDTEGVTDEAILFLIRNQGKEVYMTLSDQSIMFPQAGSQSQKLRNTILVLHQKTKDYGKTNLDFEAYYSDIMDKFNLLIADKISKLETDFLIENEAKNNN